MRNRTPPLALGTPRGRLVGLALIAALSAVAVRAAVLVHSGGLSGLVGYDQGVYYSAAEALAWGRVPYRDFLFLHPPGVVLTLWPLGLVGRMTHDSLGIDLARWFVILVGGVNAGLVTLAARRCGLWAAGCAGLFYSVWPPVVVTETEPRLEPFVSLGLLCALAVLVPRIDRGPGRRMLLLAGAALGYAATVKIWAVVPVLVILAFGVRWHGRRALLWLTAGMAVAGSSICLPFLAKAPAPMFRMVVTDQLSRGRMSSSAAHRAAGMLGLHAYLHDPSPGSGLRTVLLVGAVALALVFVLVRPARVAVVLLLAQGGVVLASPSYFSYYDAYVAPALALCVAGFVAAGWALGSRLSRRPRVWTTRVGAALSGCAITVVAMVGAVAVGGDSVVAAGRAFPAVALRSAVAHARCVTADSVGALVQLDVFGRDLRRGCPVVVDPGGLSHDRDALARAGLQVPRRYDLAWQRDMRSYLLSGTAVLVRRGLDGFDRLTRHDIRHAGVVMTDGPYRVFGSTGCHPGLRRAIHRPRPTHAHATKGHATKGRAMKGRAFQGRATSSTTCHRG